MSFFHGTLQAPASTGTQAITGLGFQPKLLLITGIATNSLNTELSSYRRCFGYSNVSEEYSISTLFDFSGTVMRHEDQKIYSGRHDGTFSITPTDIANVQSFDTDGFTLNWTSKTSTQFRLSYLALQYIDNSKILLCDTPTVTGNQAYTGVGFLPTHLVLLSSNLNQRTPDTSQNRLSVGWSDGTTEWSTGVFVARNGFREKILSWGSTSADSTFEEANVASLDSDGFTLNFTQVDGTVRKFTVLCMKLPYAAKVGYTQVPAATGSQAITGVGFHPIYGHWSATRDTVLGQSSQDNGATSDSYSNGSGQIGANATVRTGALAYKRHRLETSGKLIYLRDPTGSPTVENEASFTSFDSDGFTLNWATVDASQPYYGYVMFGDPLEGVILRSVTSALNITQTLDSNFKVENPMSVLDFAQAVVSNLAYGRSASNTINFLQKAGLTWEEAVSSTINFSQEAYRRTFATTVINFSHEVTGGVTQEFESILNLAQLLIRQMERNRTVESQITFNQILNYYMEKANVTCDYTPFSGEGGVDPTVPILGSTTLTLDDGVNPPLVLKNPEMGNTDSLRFTRINRETQGGNLILFSDSSWPKEQVLNMQLVGLKSTVKASLETFLADTLGQLITLTDHHNRQWSGIILNPDTEFVQDNIDSYSVSLQFEGELI